VSRLTLEPEQPPICGGTRGSLAGDKTAGHEADHSLPFSAQIKNSRKYNSPATYNFMAWCLIKGRDNFTFFTSMKSLGNEHKEFNIPNAVFNKRRGLEHSRN
jgi:hypothetical protein